MAKYRVLEKCFHQNHIRDVGDIVDHEGPSGKHMKLLASEKASKPTPASDGADDGGDLA